jgi:hypothetical protein
MVKQDVRFHDEDLGVGDLCFCVDQPLSVVADSAHDGGDGDDDVY